MMGRQVAIAIALVVLAATAPIASASNHSALVVGSSHTTASDFNGAAELDGVFVTGTGSSADVELLRYFDGFEDESADSGEPEGWSDIGGGGGSASVSTAQAYEGSQSMEMTGTKVTRADQSFGAATANASAAIRDSSGDSARFELVEDGDRVIQVAMDGGDLTWYDGTTFNTISTTPDSGEWVLVTLYDINPATDTFAVAWETSSASGTQTGIDSRRPIDDGYDNIWATGGGGGPYWWDNIRSEGGGAGDVGRYVSDTHVVENASQAFVNTTLVDAHADYRIEHGGGPWSVGASGTLSTTGNHSIDIGGQPDATQWRTNVTLVNESQAATTAAIHDEGIQFRDHTPTEDNATAAPTGALSTSSPTLSIQANDTDFPLAQGDSVDVEFFVDGSPVGTDTLTSNGTASQTASNLGGGSHTWHAVLTDSYGLQSSSATFSISTPDELTIRPEERPDQIISKDIQATFYFQEQSQSIVTRSITDGSGTVDMEGLSTGEPMIVSVGVDGYHSRRIYLQSLFESSNIYVLNESAASNRIRFTHQDYSGDFPKENTVLQVERALNTSGSLEWRTVEGDYFGASGGFETRLRTDVRHRLVLHNVETGDTREDFGSFIPTADGTHLVQINPDSSVNLQQFAPFATVRPGIRQLSASDNQNITVRVDNQSTALQDWTVTMTFQNETSTDVLATTTRSGPGGGTVEESLNLDGRADGNLTVEVTMTGVDGNQFDDEAVYSISDVFVNEHALLPVLGDVPGMLPATSVGAFTSMIATLTTLIVTVGLASQVPVSSEGLALVAVLILAFFAGIGWAPFSFVFVAGSAAVIFAGLKRGI